MKTLHLSIMVGVAITMMITFTYVILTASHSNGPTGAVSPQMNNTTNISTVIIPNGSEDQNSGKNYEPQLLVVVLGVNNTVRWINEALVGNTIAPDTPVTQGGKRFGGYLMAPGKSFNFTFTKVGDFGYHSEPHPWLRGWVLVLPQSNENLTQTVVLNDTYIPSPCEMFAVPCP